MSLSSPVVVAHGEVLLRGRVVLEVVQRGVRLDRPPERRVVEHLRDLLAADVDLARLAERFQVLGAGADHALTPSAGAATAAGSLLKTVRALPSKIACRSLVAQPVDLLDDGAEVVHVAARLGVERGADAGRLGAEEAAVGADDAQQEVERLRVVEDGVEPEPAQVLVERPRAPLDALGPPAADLVRDRPAAVADDQPQRGEVLEDARLDQREDRDRLLGDEVVRVRLAMAAAPGRVDRGRARRARPSSRRAGTSARRRAAAPCRRPRPGRG